MARAEANTVGTCWDKPQMPAPELLKALKAGPFGKTNQAELIASLRRESCKAGGIHRHRYLRTRAGAAKTSRPSRVT